VTATEATPAPTTVTTTEATPAPTTVTNAVTTTETVPETTTVTTPATTPVTIELTTPVTTRVTTTVVSIPPVHPGGAAPEELDFTAEPYASGDAAAASGLSSTGSRATPLLVGIGLAALLPGAVLLVATRRQAPGRKH
jgi:hypothetical protein